VSQKVTLSGDALFDTGKANLKPDSKAALDELVGKLSGVKLEVLVVTGHTDSTGAAALNDRLSLRRAESVKAYLVSKGIEANRVYTEGKGARQPIADNKTAQGRQQNRRVEVEVVGSKTMTQ
jgi:OmpA-OmpF porin, OOP family